MVRQQLCTPIPFDRESYPAVLEVAAVASAVTVGAWVKLNLPFSPVPLTLQTFAVIAAALTIPERNATRGILLYIAAGLAGAPLFAGAAFGPSFGYILGFLLVPFIVNRIPRTLLSITVSTVTIYAIGCIWLMLWGRIPLGRAMAIGVAPFVLGDMLKAAMAYGLARWLRRAEIKE